VLPEVGLSEEHPGLCLRCYEAVTDEAPDVHAWACARFDRLYSAARAAGMSRAEAAAEAADVNLNGARA
jgi:hypothetical protein